MQVNATLNNLRIAPRKSRLVTDMIVGMDAREALVVLDKQAKKSAGPVLKLLESAIANATNNFGLDDTNLFVKSAAVGDGTRLKRWLPRAFGRATPIIRRSCNIYLVLEEKIEGLGRKEKKEMIEEIAIEESVETKEQEAEKTEEKVIRHEEGKDRRLMKVTNAPKAGFAKKVFQRKSS